MRSEFALITGASRGIGLRFARALAGRKRDLVLVSRSKDRLEAIADELSRQFSIQVEVIVCDLAADGAGVRLGKMLAERDFSIDLLVNNAGYGTRGRFWQIPADQVSDMVRLNVEAVVDLTYALLPSMLERRRGGIINVSSLAGFQPMPNAAIYAATKAFITTFSVALAE